MTFYEKSRLNQCRLDLWLWAARFYKTRNIAASNIKKGCVSILGKTKTKPASLLTLGNHLVIEQDLVKKTILVEEIAIKRVSFEKARQFYKIIFEDSKEASIFFQAKARRNPDKKVRRNLKALKDKITLSFQ